MFLHKKESGGATQVLKNRPTTKKSVGRGVPRHLVGVGHRAAGQGATIRRGRSVRYRPWQPGKLVRPGGDTVEASHRQSTPGVTPGQVAGSSTDAPRTVVRMQTAGSGGSTLMASAGKRGASSACSQEQQELQAKRIRRESAPGRGEDLIVVVEYWPGASRTPRRQRCTSCDGSDTTRSDEEDQVDAVAG